MSEPMLYDVFINYIFLVVIITFHEFGHAWSAWRLGDDTARLLGRVTLNPVAHMEVIGTVVLPLLAMFLSASGSALGSFIIGWGKPVPVNIANLRRKPLDDILVSMAGPAMNVVLALMAMGVARTGIFLHSAMLVEACERLALISMGLCFFNLIPIPPLDGSHVLKYLIGMSYETFWRVSQFGIFAVILLLQMPPVREFLALSTVNSVRLMQRLFFFG